MKLVAAKCPSCGAQIDVDNQSESTVCDFCNARIFVEEAVEKHRVEIDNLPKAENFFTLGNRAYKNKEYDEAYEYYTKGLELSPNNELAVFRRGLAKGLSQSYPKTDIKPAINSFNNVLDMLNKNKASNKKFNNFVSEMNFFLVTVELDAIEYYNKGLSTLSSVQKNVDFLLEIFRELEKLLDLVRDDDKLKSDILYYLITLIDNLLENKGYSGGIYRINSVTYQELTNKRKKYIELQNKINGIEGKVENKEVKVEFSEPGSYKKHKNNQIIFVLICIFYGAFSITALAYDLVLAFLFCLFTIFIFIPNIHKKLPKSFEFLNKKFVKCSFAIVTFIIMALSISTVVPSDVYIGKFEVKDFEGFEINIDNYDVEIVNGDFNIKYDYYSTVMFSYDVPYVELELSGDEEQNIKYIRAFMYNDTDVCVCLVGENNACTSILVNKDSSKYKYVDSCKNLKVD